MAASEPLPSAELLLARRILDGLVRGTEVRKELLNGGWVEWAVSVLELPTGQVVAIASTVGDGAYVPPGVVIPASVPFILVGVRIGLGSAWATVVAAELIAAQSGLGFRMQQAQLYYDLPTIFVSLITGPRSDIFLSMIDREIRRAIEAQTGPATPFVKFAVGTQRFERLEKRVSDTVVRRVLERQDELSGYAAQAMDLPALLGEVTGAEKGKPAAANGVAKVAGP